MFEDNFEPENMTLGALVDLRDQLTDLIKPKTQYNEQLLNKVDLALCKELDKLIKK